MTAAPRYVHRPGEPAPRVGSWEEIGPPECPIMYRRTLVAHRLGKLLVHRFMPNASDEAHHDHPRSFLTIVLRGGYEDISLCSGCRGSEYPGWHLGEPSEDWRHARPMTICETCRGRGVLRDQLSAPAVRLRRAEHAHITKVGPRGAVTVVVMGPLRRDWGFWRDGKWYPWRAFERLFGLNWRCPE